MTGVQTCALPICQHKRDALPVAMQIEAKRPIDRDPLRRAKQRRFIAADVAGQGEASLRPPLSIEVSPASAEINGG